jgi:hypothetical protein
MNDTYSGVGIFVIALLFLITIGSLIGQSFTKSGAEKLQEEAIDLCLEGGSGSDLNLTRYRIKTCRDNHPIERYLIDWFDYLIFGVFVFPLIFAVSLLIFTISGDPYRKKPRNKTKKGKSSKSNDGWS